MDPVRSDSKQKPLLLQAMFLVPLIAFLAVSFFAWKRGGTGNQHSQIVSFLENWKSRLRSPVRGHDRFYGNE
jgi:hypothetical protein